MIRNLVATLCLLLSLPAWSLVELRMTYTGLSNKPEKDKLYSGSGSIPNTKPVAGIGGDLMIYLPVTSLGLGLRYESMTLNYKGNGIEYDGNGARTSAVLGWRWVDNVAYFGPVLTYGISHSGGKVKVTQSGSTISDLTAEKQSSYSAGLELGMKLIGFRVGAEAGYMNYEWKDLNGTVGSVTTANKFDLSGTYAKVLIGFSL